MSDRKISPPTLALPFDHPESWELISEELAKVCDKESSWVRTPEEYQQLLCHLAHYSGCAPLDVRAMKAYRGEGSRRKSKRGSKKDQNTLPAKVEVPSYFADVVPLFEQLRGISSDLYDAFFDFVLPTMSRYVLDGPESLQGDRPKLLVKGRNGSVTISSRLSLYILCSGFLCLLPSNPRLASPNFKRFFYRSNSSVPTQGHKLACFLNYFTQALGYAPLRPANVEPPSEAGDEAAADEAEEVEERVEYEDAAYEKLVELNSKEAYLRVARRVVEDIAPKRPPSEGWLDEDWWSSCSARLSKVGIFDTSTDKSVVESSGCPQFLPYNRVISDDELAGKILLGLTSNKPFGDALGLGTGVEEAYAMGHPEALAALALCEPTSTGTIPEGISICGGRRYSIITGVGGSFTCCGSLLDVSPSTTACPDTGLPLANREIISLVRLPRSESSKAKKDDGGISRTAECIDTLNELILSVPSATLAKGGGVFGGQADGYPLSPLPLTAPLILYPITNSAPLGAMGVSTEGRFVLLWLAASVLGRPLLLWDRIEEVSGHFQ
ncbi:hypothetical protein FOZ61_004779 [Perkinsus olseni]|uniref:PARG helical domain-containing protein n=1 Tax=Perkinsus olseni TaxID=32597 RepID=A0A7J6MCE8_PEROL|nr:hypothetical protein FOZ61_004779 [Perkinsus olseni]